MIPHQEIPFAFLAICSLFVFYINSDSTSLFYLRVTEKSGRKDLELKRGMAGNTGGRAIGSAGSALSVPAMTKAGERLSENENSAVLAWGLCLQDLKCVTGRVCFVLGLLQGTGSSGCPFVLQCALFLSLQFWWGSKCQWEGPTRDTLWPPLVFSDHGE